ncbi:hypothetical protein D3C86_1927800 [compost metagenome]
MALALNTSPFETFSFTTFPSIMIWTVSLPLSPNVLVLPFAPKLMAGTDAGIVISALSHVFALILVLV